MKNFDPLVQHVKAICKNYRVEYAGALLRPHAGYVEYLLSQDKSVDFIYNNAYEVGKQLASDGVMSQETLDDLSQTLVDQQSYSQGFNDSWHQLFEKMK